MLRGKDAGGRSARGAVPFDGRAALELGELASKIRRQAGSTLAGSRRN